MKLERTKNAKLNTIWGLVGKLVAMVFPFIVRALLIKSLGIEYLGLNSLFTAILNLLNITELGVGTAIVFSMYKPIAEDNEEVICALMNLYKKIYRIIGLIVLIIGLLLVPFLPNLIKGDAPNNVNLYVLYFIYLTNSVITYWLFAYKNCLLAAFQQSHIQTKIQIVTSLLMYVFQIAVLLSFHNFYIYAAALPLSSLVNNLLTARSVSKKYPQFNPKGRVSKFLLKDISKRVAGLFMTKLAFISRGTVGNVVVSAFLGIEMVGIYNNYAYINTALANILVVFLVSISAGIGNSLITESIEKNENDLKVINFLFMSISYISYCCLIVLFQPFMKLWIGDQFLLAESLMLSLGLFYLVERFLGVVGHYYDAAGLWWIGKWKGLFEMLANVLFIIIGCKYWGILGMAIGTSFSVLFVAFPLTTYYLFKYFFKKSSINFYFSSILLFLIFFILGLIVYFTCNYVVNSDNLYIEIFLKLILCVPLSLGLYFMVMFKTKIFKESFSWVKSHGFLSIKR